VLLIIVHLSMWFILCVGAVALLRFNVAMFMFARFFIGLGSLFSPGAGFSLVWWFALPAALGGARGTVGGAGAGTAG
jgi:hypothetical protein